LSPTIGEPDARGGHLERLDRRGLDDLTVVLDVEDDNGVIDRIVDVPSPERPPRRKRPPGERELLGWL
jgi:hypothetical protein